MAVERGTVEAVAASVGHKASDGDVRWAQNLDAVVGRVIACARGATDQVVLTRADCADLVTLWQSQRAASAP